METATDSFPAVLITAIPMGILADRVGRKKVIASSVLGPILQMCWILVVCRSIYSCFRTKEGRQFPTPPPTQRKLLTTITTRQAWAASTSEA